MYQPRFSTKTLDEFYKTILSFVDFAVYIYTPVYIEDKPDSPILDWMIEEVLSTFGGEIWRQDSPHLTPGVILNIGDSKHRQLYIFIPAPI